MTLKGYYISRRFGDEGHHGFPVTRAGGSIFRKELIQLFQVRRGQVHIERSDVLLQVGPSLCAENGDDVFTLGQDPSQRELPCGASFF